MQAGQRWCLGPISVLVGARGRCRCPGSVPVPGVRTCRAGRGGRALRGAGPGRPLAAAGGAVRGVAGRLSRCGGRGLGLAFVRSGAEAERAAAAGRAGPGGVMSYQGKKNIPRITVGAAGGAGRPVGRGGAKLVAGVRRCGSERGGGGGGVQTKSRRPRRCPGPAGELSWAERRGLERLRWPAPGGTRCRWGFPRAGPAFRRALPTLGVPAEQLLGLAVSGAAVPLQRSGTRPGEAAAGGFTLKLREPRSHRYPAVPLPLRLACSALCPGNSAPRLTLWRPRRACSWQGSLVFHLVGFSLASL